MTDAASQREAYLPDHRWLDDSELLAAPARGPLTRLTLFVCTYVAKLGNLNTGLVEMTRVMCANPHGCLLAVNSNFGHAAQPGCERFLKAPRPPPERRVPARGRPRKVQGDGTCFNSAIEPVVAVDHPGILDDKVYFVKCFPTTGETQIPGVIYPDLSDGHDVLVAFVAYLNELEVGIPEEASGAGAPRRKPVVITSEQPKMLNYKFRVNRNSPRILVDLNRLAIYLQHLEELKLSDSVVPTERQAARFAGWPAIVLPPYTVRETKRPIDDVKISFRFEGEDRAPRVNVFQGGKVNILGADSVEAAERIYDYCVRLFTANWAMLVCLQPRRDLERRARPPRPSVPARGPPEAPPLSDADVAELLSDVLGDEFDAAEWLKSEIQSAVDAADAGAVDASDAADAGAVDTVDASFASFASVVADLDDEWESENDENVKDENESENVENESESADAGV